MASTTTRVAIPEGKTWTEVCGSSLKGAIRLQSGPAGEVFFGETASAPTAGTEGFPIDFRDIIQFTTAADEKAWVRCQGGNTLCHVMKQDA